uniref:UBA/THIF-type NAD/FAD binding protein n=1 Tax=Caulobacter sp. (strain K31) TaxID=366602 RepID=B0T6R2_CAUSK
MAATLRMTGRHARRLHAHLFPGDGKEAVAIALCGRRRGAYERLLVHKLVLIPHGDCDLRTPLTVAWSTDLIVPALEEAERRGWSVVKFHSHPGGYNMFSDQDDLSDGLLFPAIHGWVEHEVAHASVVMLPDGAMFGRTVDAQGVFSPLEAIVVAGERIEIWRHSEVTGEGVIAPLPDFAKRHAQAFGVRTTRRLSHLSVAVVGCSGTGSIVIEQLYRLGVGRLVIVDPDVVKDINLNRILNTTSADAAAARAKVEVLHDTIVRTGLGTDVLPIAKSLFDPEAIAAVADCDLVFGCVDSAEARFLINRITAFYVMPYFDVGVALDADQAGRITQVCGYLHYVQPDQSSMVSRGAISMEEVRAEGEKRRNPEHYANLRQAGYIQNVDEDRPAVISVNTVFSGLIVNEFLARLHDFRDDPGDAYATIGFSLSQMMFYPEAESGMPCRVFSPHVGRGDTRLLLDMPEFSLGQRS